jgi:large subunit ribosomal protein L20
MAGFSKQKYFRLAKGFYGRSKNCLKLTIPRVEKSLQKAYIGRKLRPRTMRRNWIISISAATRDLNLPYSRFISSLNNSNVNLNRKILSDLAINEPYSFKAVFDEINVQTERLPQPRISVESLIRKNLITAAQLEREAYNPLPQKGIKVRY